MPHGLQRVVELAKPLLLADVSGILVRRGYLVLKHILVVSFSLLVTSTVELVYFVTPGYGNFK